MPVQVATNHLEKNGPAVVVKDPAVSVGLSLSLLRHGQNGKEQGPNFAQATLGRVATLARSIPSAHFLQSAPIHFDVLNELNARSAQAIPEVVAKAPADAPSIP